MRFDRSRNGVLPAAAAAAWLVAAVAACLAATAGSVSAADADSEEGATVRKSKDGLHFNLPSDWPLEKRGGVTAPIPIEEYLSKKFSAVNAQLQSLEQRVNGLDVKLRVVEEDLKQRRAAEAQQVAPSSQPAPAAGTNGR